MNHDFRKEPECESADLFRAWLERETIDMLRRTVDDAEGTKAAIFLYVNRAYEAHMPEEEIGGLFGKCFVTAGFPKSDEDAAWDLLEFFGDIARRAHNR